jgi:hypothetical protein
MRFLNSVWFLAVNAILGLFANVLAVGGFVLGVIQPNPSWGALSKPWTILTLLYLFMAISWLLVAFLFIHVLKRRHEVGLVTKINPTARWSSSFTKLLYVVTVPTTVLWILAWIEISGPVKPGYADPSGEALFLIGGATLVFSGLVVAHFALAIDWFFNPTHYTEDPTSPSGR